MRAVSILHPSSFILSVRGLPDNPLTRREWRALAHQSRDWRLWLGLKIPKDARGWGLPAIAWCCILPYALAFALRMIQGWVPRQYGYLPPEQMPDVLALSFGLVGFYLCLISVALMAPAITREREKETWEALKTSVSSPTEIVLGIAAGRLGPVLVAYAAVGLFWLLARPHYAPLFAQYAPFRLDSLQLALLLAEGGALACACGALALAASTGVRSTGRAVLLAVWAVLGLGGLIAVPLMLLPSIPHPLIVFPVAIAATVGGYLLALHGAGAE